MERYGCSTCNPNCDNSDPINNCESWYEVPASAGSITYRRFTTVAIQSDFKSNKERKQSATGQQMWGEKTGK